MQFNKTLQTKKFQQDRENFLKATAMSLIGKITSPTPTLDSTTTIFDAIEYLIINDCDHAFVQHEGEMVGIVSAEQLLGNYRSKELSGATIREYMGPLLTIKQNEPQARAAEIMLEHDAECIAVTNQGGVLVGVACFKKLNSSSLQL
jgi:CBS domain-containing protein